MRIEVFQLIEEVFLLGFDQSLLFYQYAFSLIGWQLIQQSIIQSMTSILFKFLTSALGTSIPAI